MMFRLYASSDERDALEILRAGLTDQARYARLSVTATDDGLPDMDFFEQAWERDAALLREHPEWWWVAEEDNQVAGIMRIEYPSESVALRHFEPHALIAQISVHPEMRNRGIGMTMLPEAERLARDSCVGLILIYGYAANPAIQLYYRAGFVDIPKEHRKDRNPRRAYLWKRFNPLRAEWLE